MQMKFELVQNYRVCGLYIEKRKKSPDGHFPPILHLVTGCKRGVGKWNYLQTNRRLSIAVLRGNSYQGIMVCLITQAVRVTVTLAKCTLCLFSLFKRALSASLRLPNDTVLTSFSCHSRRAFFKWPSVEIY